VLGVGISVDKLRTWNFKTANGNPLKHKKPHKKTQQNRNRRTHSKRGNHTSHKEGKQKTHNEKKPHQHKHTKTRTPSHTRKKPQRTPKPSQPHTNHKPHTHNNHPTSLARRKRAAYHGGGAVAGACLVATRSRTGSALTGSPLPRPFWLRSASLFFRASVLSTILGIDRRCRS